MKADSNIVSLFIAAVSRHKNAIAFIEKERQTTYIELLQQVQRAAAGFAKKGIEKGDKVLVFVPMNTQLYVVVLALLYIGAIPVFLDEWVSMKRLKACLLTVPCKAIVASPKLLLISCFVGSLRHLKKMTPQIGMGKDILQKMAETSPEDTALVTFTTGSTGTPKAANRTHQFLQAQYEALHPILANNYRVTLTLLPIVVLLNLCLGKTNILPAKKLVVLQQSSAIYLLTLIARHHIETIIASPAIAVAMATSLLNKKTGNSYIRQIITGGGPLFPSQACLINKAFSQANGLVVFGSTEAEPISSISMQQLAITSTETMQQHGLPVGSIHSSAAVAIVPFTKEVIPDIPHQKFTQIKLPAGMSGELLVSGPHVLQQYINNEAAQRQNKFRVDGQLWHRTGDEAFVDEKENLYFLGRCTEVIFWNNQKLYPLIFTWLLKQQVPVKEAALLPHHNRLLLVLEQKDNTLAEQVKMYLKSTLPDATIFWIKIIPKDKRHQTKIDYERLRQLLK